MKGNKLLTAMENKHANKPPCGSLNVKNRGNHNACSVWPGVDAGRGLQSTEFEWSASCVTQ